MDLDQINEQANALLGKAVDLFSQPFNIPSYGGVSTAPVKEQLSRVKGTRDTTQTVIDAESMRTERATTEQKTGIKEEGSAAAALAWANQEKAQKIADNYNLFSDIFGVGQKNATEIAASAKEIKNLDESIRQLIPEVEAKAEVVRNMQAVGPGDDFLQWFGNQFQLSSKIADYNRSAEKLNSLDDRRDEFQKHLNQGVETAEKFGNYNVKGIPTILASEAKATADKAVAQAKQLSSIADIALAKTNVEFATKKLAEDLAVFSATKESTQQDIDQAREKYASQINAIKFADTHAVRLEQAGKMLMDIGDKQSLKIVLDKYDQITGKPNGTTNIFLFNKMPTAERENIVAIAMGNGGSGPVEAFMNLNRKLGPQASPETRRILGWIGEQAAAIDANPQMKLIENPKLRMEAIDKQLKLKIEQEKQLAYKNGNLFHELTPSAMLMGDSPVIPQESPLGKILAPLAVQSGNVETEAIARTIMATYSNPADAGKALSQYYQANINAINKSSNFELVKIAPIKEYIVPAPIVGFFAPDKYNLMNTAKATQYIQAIKKYDIVNKENAAVTKAALGL